MSAAQTHVTQGAEVSPNLLSHSIAAKQAMWESIANAGGKIAGAVLERHERQKTFFAQQQDIFKSIDKQRDEIDYSHLQQFDEGVKDVKDEMTQAFKTMRPKDYYKPEFQTWLREKQAGISKLADRSKAFKEQYPAITKLYQDPTTYGDKMMADWAENEKKSPNDSDYDPNFLATAQNSSKYLNAPALAIDALKKKQAITHNYSRIKDGFSEVMDAEFRPSLGSFDKNNQFQVKVDPAIADELLQNPRFADAMATQVNNGTLAKDTNGNIDPTRSTFGLDLAGHANQGNGDQVDEAIKAHTQNYLEELVRKELSPQHVIKQRTQLTQSRKPTAAEELDQVHTHNARTILSDISSGTSNPFSNYESAAGESGYGDFKPVYGNGKANPPTAYSYNKKNFSKNKDVLGRYKLEKTEEMVPATVEGLKNFVVKYNEGKATQKAKYEASLKQPSKKEIKRSDIAAKAKASNRSVDEYTKLLEQNGVKIVD